MKVSDFHFDLPAELIAQEPLPERSASRMLVVNRETGSFEDRRFTDFPDYIQPGDKLVVNNTRVLPARLIGSRAGGGGGRVEALLVKRLADDPPRWEALVRPAKRIRTGETLLFAEGLKAKVVDTGERGIRELEFDRESGFLEALEAAGSMPLPPYIKRAAGASDRERYQTVYADQPGSAAAPTAGLHFTPEILEAVERKDASRVEITLEVGLGTFQPITSESIETHRLHSERYTMTPAAAARLNEPGRVVAIGTLLSPATSNRRCGAANDKRANAGTLRWAAAIQGDIGRNGPIHLRRLPVSDSRRDVDELPSAWVVFDHAGLRFRRTGARFGGLPACGRAALPVLFLRRLHVSRVNYRLR